MKLLVVVEQTETGFSAYAPDLEGCVATGATRAEVEARMSEAIKLHIAAMHSDGRDVPTPSTYVTVVEVAPLP